MSVDVPPTSVYPPVLQRTYDCDDCADLTIGQVALGVLCCPCVYGAGLTRIYESPMHQQGLCRIKHWTWWLGCCCPPCAGALIRRRFAENPRPPCVLGLLHETVCCCCLCAPCAMDDFRLYDCQINTLLSPSLTESKLYDDGGPY